MKEIFEAVPNSSERENIIESKEITQGDIEKEVERVSGIIREYMSDENGSKIFQIKEALKVGNSNLADSIKKEVLDDLEAQIIFIDSMEKEELGRIKNKVEAVMHYYQEKF